MRIAISDVFLMPTDGKAPQFSTSEETMVVVITENGKFYSLKKRAKNTTEQLTKAYSLAESILDSKIINTTNWDLLDSQYVVNSYPYSAFNVAV